MNKTMKLLVCAILALSIVFATVSTIAAVAPPATAVIYGNNAYGFYTGSYTRNEAIAECNAMGGKLVSINSAAEQSFIEGKAASGDYWTGAYDSDGWRWEDGSLLSYDNWVSGEDNSIYGYISGSDSKKWKSNNGSLKCGYICEWEGGAAALTTTTTTTTAAPATTAAVPASTEATAAPTTPSTQVAASTEATAQAAPNATTRTTVRQPIATIRPTVTVPQTFENETIITTRNALGSLNINDTIFVFENIYYYQIANDSEVVISYYVGTSSEVEIPDSIDGMPVLYIGQRAFQDITITSATIPACVVSIDDSAFSNVSSDFTVCGVRGSEAEAFAAKFGYQFSEAIFYGDEDSSQVVQLVSAVADGSPAQEPANKLPYIIGGVAIIVIAAALAVFFAIRRRRMAEAFDADMQQMDENEGFGEEPEIESPTFADGETEAQTEQENSAEAETPEASEQDNE